MCNSGSSCNCISSSRSISSSNSSCCVIVTGVGLTTQEVLELATLSGYCPSVRHYVRQTIEGIISLHTLVQRISLFSYFRYKNSV